MFVFFFLSIRLLDIEKQNRLKQNLLKFYGQMKQSDVYVWIRGRIALRKARVDNAKEEEMLVKAKTDKVKGNKGTEDDIIEVREP
jgi:hypothetical protein